MAWKNLEGQKCEYRDEKRLVRALIIPIITYGSELWTLTKKMEKNQCLRIMVMEEDDENIMEGEKDQ